MPGKAKTTALATVDSFQIANRYADMAPELLEELQDQMDDLDSDSGITCRKIKIPSGGGLAYEVQGEDESDVEYIKEIQGVIVFTHRANGYWIGSYGDNDQNKLPACSSMDGKTGMWTASGEVRNCDTCSLNQYGSATNQAGESSRGKACKNMRRIYLMMSNDPNLYLLTVPPTSTKDVNRQISKILAGGVPYTGLIVTLKLERAQNAAGVAYSKVVIAPSGLLSPETSAATLAVRRQIKEQYKNASLTLDDYTAAPAQQSTSDYSRAAYDYADTAQTAEYEEVGIVESLDLPFSD
jgi:hypothetical protein